MNPLIRPWRHLFDFKGRATRTEYLLFHLTGVVAVMVALLISGIIWGLVSALLNGRGPERNSPGVLIIVVLIYLTFFITHIAIGVRRLHDQGEPGVKYLLNFIPFVGFIFWLMMVLKRGDDFENDYGQDPRQPERAPTEELGSLFS